MKFHYIAKDGEGREVLGDLESESSAAVLVFLAQKGLRPVEVSRMKDESSFISKFHFGMAINITDQVFLTRYFALMLRVGADLIKVIDVLIADFEKPALKAFLLDVRSSLEKGQQLYTSFAKFPQYFSPVFVNLVKAGERSGNLESVFESLSISLERERDFKGRVTAALVYPCFIAFIAVVILLFLVVFALPKIAGVFAGSGFNPPLFSRVVFAVGAFLNQYLFVFLGIFVFGAVTVWYVSAKTRFGKDLWESIISRIHLVSRVFKKISLQRFTSTLSTLMKAGLPIIEALRITSDVVSYPGMRDALLRVADEGVAKGLTLGVSFHKEIIFPPIVTNLISVSEKAGRIDEVLKTLAGFFETEVDNSLKQLISFVEPIMLLMIGGIVGVIALAIILPVYQLTSQF